MPDHLHERVFVEECRRSYASQQKKREGTQGEYGHDLSDLFSGLWDVQSGRCDLVTEPLVLIAPLEIASILLDARLAYVELRARWCCCSLPLGSHDTLIETYLWVRHRMRRGQEAFGNPDSVVPDPAPTVS